MGSSSNMAAMRMHLTDLQMQRASFTDGFRLLCSELLYTLTEAPLPTGCSQPVTEHSKDTKSGPFLINKDSSE